MKYNLIILAASSIPWGAFAVHGHHHNHRRQHVSHSHGECIPPQVPLPCTTIVTSYLVPVEASAVPTTALTDHEPETYTDPNRTVTLESAEYVCIPEITTPTVVSPVQESTSNYGSPVDNTVDDTVDSTIDITITVVPIESTPPPNPNLVVLEPGSSQSKGVAVPLASTTTTTSSVQEQPSTPPSGPIKPPWAITYSHYNADHTCMSKEDAERDIADIAAKGIKNIRLYSSDCNSLDTVAPACKKHGIKIILGIFIHDASCQADDDLNRILEWKKWDQVSMFVVGNEALMNKLCTPDQLTGYITKVKGQLKNAGYTGLVTTAEPLGQFEEHPKICGVLDVVSIHCHPFFNSGFTADKAGTFMNDQIDSAKKLCGKDVYVLEAGWPSGGPSQGKAIASKDAQKTAFMSFQQDCPAVGDKVVYFTYRNDLWKPAGVEQNFGCGELIG